MKLVYIILILLCFNACEGWYIAGYELEPNTNELEEFNDLIHKDSTNYWEI